MLLNWRLYRRRRSTIMVTMQKEEKRCLQVLRRDDDDNDVWTTCYMQKDLENCVSPHVNKSHQSWTLNDKSTIFFQIKLFFCFCQNYLINRHFLLWTIHTRTYKKQRKTIFHSICVLHHFAFFYSFVQTEDRTRFACVKPSVHDITDCV